VKVWIIVFGVLIFLYLYFATFGHLISSEDYLELPENVKSTFSQTVDWMNGFVLFENEPTQADLMNPKDEMIQRVLRHGTIKELLEKLNGFDEIDGLEQIFEREKFAKIAVEEGIIELLKTLIQEEVLKVESIKINNRQGTLLPEFKISVYGKGNLKHGFERLLELAKNNPRMELETLHYAGSNKGDELELQTEWVYQY
jgi:hypothetical protein